MSDVDLLGFVAAFHLEGFELVVKGGFPLPPSLHTIVANSVGVVGLEDVPVQDEGLVAGKCVGQLLHVEFQLVGGHNICWWVEVDLTCDVIVQLRYLADELCHGEVQGGHDPSNSVCSSTK